MFTEIFKIVVVNNLNKYGKNVGGWFVGSTEATGSADIGSAAIGSVCGDSASRWRRRVSFITVITARKRVEIAVVNDTGRILQRDSLHLNDIIIIKLIISVSLAVQIEAHVRKKLPQTIIMLAHFLGVLR